MSLRGKSWLVVLVVLYMTGLAMTWALFEGNPWNQNTLEVFLTFLLAPLFYMMCLLFPYGIIVLGAMRLRKRRAELEAMDDTLADVDPEVADRKLREYVAARQGLEARIGLVERTHAHDMANATHTLLDDDPRGLPRVQP